MLKSISNHWPEYLMEAWGLGTFMVAACLGTAVLWNPDSPVQHWVGDSPYIQRLLMGIAMGLTAIGIVYSPWGKQSGAHINPSLTLTFLRLGKIHAWDALFYIVFQFAGAIAGVVLTWLLLGNYLAAPQVDFAVTVPSPGDAGIWIAFLAEFLISAGIMATVLIVSNNGKLTHFTGIFIGILLVLYITFEAPYSGMSMNPARTVGSAVVANVWTGMWLYFVAPTLGMLLAAEIYLWTKGKDAVHCAKLHHTSDVRCIFKCGFQDMMDLDAETSN
ncbi:aquaporin [bacterium]|nr:aquaporin [bacterium]